MAFEKRALARCATSQHAAGASASMYFHSTADAVAVVLAAGYFNDARDTLSVGDIIFCVADNGGTSDILMLLVKTVPASGDVTVSAETGAAGA